MLIEAASLLHGIRKRPYVAWECADLRAIVVVAVDVQDLLTLDTQDTGVVGKLSSLVIAKPTLKLLPREHAFCEACKVCQ